MTTTQRPTFYVQVSTDGGKTFATVTRTTSRQRAFADYLDLHNDVRALLWKDNTLMLSTHREDAENEIARRAEGGLR